MLKEFQEFALKGNVVDMAVGIIIGGAFGTIVKSLVDDVIMPHGTRARICKSLRMLKNKDIKNPWKKHGNIPL